MFRVMEFVGSGWREVFESNSIDDCLRYVNQAVKELDLYDPQRNATLRIESGYEVVWQG
jgi:uncharacterized protein YbdZ (MbtH family)